MAEGTWEKLSQVAVLGAEYDSPERQPHPKCLEGTRVDLLKFIYGLLDKREKSQIIWLHGTAGVGKSAVAFTVAERMKGLKVTEETKIETRLAGSFFFSRKHTNRSTTGHFFATLAYQLARNFPSLQTHVNRAIRENPAVLNPNMSLLDQMKALFRRPLWHLESRLRECPPPVFVVDALDECKPETVADLISLLGQALSDPELPVVHILLTSRSEEHIRKAIQKEEMRTLVCEIPVNTSGEGIAGTISLDGEDVDNDIHVFLQHSFTELRSRHPDFPQPTADKLTRLANRAGRRFIVASTMMKFVDDGYNDPRDRLELMLELTNELLPGTEVYKLYNCILATCSDPNRAYQHLSIVAALTDPLPISQILKLLGPGQGSDIATVLVQLRSFMDISTDSSKPVNIYHSSIRDYVSDFSNCTLPGLQPITAPHSVLAHSSLRLMIQDLPKSTNLLDALSELKEHKLAMQNDDPKSLQQSLAFVVEPPEPLRVLTGLLWLRGARGPGLRSWLETLDGRAWLQTQGGKDYLQTQKGEDWLQTKCGGHWLQTHAGHTWLQTESGRGWLQSGPGWQWTQRRRQFAGDPGEPMSLETWSGQDSLETIVGQGWLETPGGREWLRTQTGGEWLQTQTGGEWLQSRRGEEWLQTSTGQVWLQKTLTGQGWLQTQRGQEWLQTTPGQEWLERNRQEWLDTESGRQWLDTKSGREWLERNGQEWLDTKSGRQWLDTKSGQEWLERNGQEWLDTESGRQWLDTKSGREWLERNGREWLDTESGRQWLDTERGRQWLDTERGRQWLDIERGRQWLDTERGRQWLDTESKRQMLDTKSGQRWLDTKSGQRWLDTKSGRRWLDYQLFKNPDQSYTRLLNFSGQKWLQKWLQSWHGKRWLSQQLTPVPRNSLETRSVLRMISGLGNLLDILSRQVWLNTQSGREWLETQDGRNWLETQDGRNWLETQGGRKWLETQDGRKWLETQDGRKWLETQDGRKWLETQDGRKWLETQDGRKWLETQDRRNWLETQGGRKWLETHDRRNWLETQDGRNWLETQDGKNWLETQDGRKWLQTQGGRKWLQTQGGRKWLQTQDGREWLQTQDGRKWLQTQGGRKWLQTQDGRKWLQTQDGRKWLQTEGGRNWLQTPIGQDWLHTWYGRKWLPTQSGREWLLTQSAEEWLLTPGGREWLHTPGGQEWLHTPSGLQTKSGREWLRTKSGQEWLLTPSGREWLQTPSGLQTKSGREWLRAKSGQEWLLTPSGREWFQTKGGREWLQTQSGRDWLQSSHGQAWQLTPAASVWVTIEDFSNTLETINECAIIPELDFPPAFQAIQEFKSLPDFLMFPAFLAFIRPQDHSTSAFPQDRPDIDVIHAMTTFTIFATEAQERSQSTSDALKYACQNWAVHLSRGQTPWNDELEHIFKLFWDRYLLAWLERQWCLKGLRSCLDDLSKGQKIAKEHLIEAAGSRV